jgi:hypothetical protein
MKPIHIIVPLLLAMSHAALIAEDAPTITKDSDDVIDASESKTVTFTVSGGSTDEPDDDRGCPPWSKTGNKRYIWKVTQQEGSLTTNPADGATSTSPTLTMQTIPSEGGKIEVSASLQEEWADSSETPIKLFWPE